MAIVVVLSLCVFPKSSNATETFARVEGFQLIDTSFENASPLDWEIDEDCNTHIQIGLTKGNSGSSQEWSCERVGPAAF